MMPTLQFNLGAHHYFDFKGHGSWVEFLAASCFVFVCLFVFQLQRWGEYFVFKSHKWVRFSCCFFVCLFVFVFVFIFGLFVCVFCFVLFLFFFVLCCFSFKMFNIPTIYLGSG